VCKVTAQLALLYNVYEWVQCHPDQTQRQLSGWAATNNRWNQYEGAINGELLKRACCFRFPIKWCCRRRVRWSVGTDLPCSFNAHIKQSSDRVMLNFGGVANITCWDGDSALVAFVTRPVCLRLSFKFTSPSVPRYILPTLFHEIDLSYCLVSPKNRCVPYYSQGL